MERKIPTKEELTKILQQIKDQYAKQDKEA